MGHPSVLGFRIDFFYPPDDSIGPTSEGRYLVAGLYGDDAEVAIPVRRFYLHREHKDGAVTHRYVVRDQDDKAIGSINGIALHIPRVIEYAHQEVLRTAREATGLPRYAVTFVAPPDEGHTTIELVRPRDQSS